MAGIAAAVVAIPALGEEIVLLVVTQQTLLTAAVLGAAGAALVELSSRIFRASPVPPRTRPAPVR